MVSTRQAKKDTMIRVFKDILDLEDDNKLIKACDHDGIASLDALLILSPLEIEDLTYNEGTNIGLKIDKGLRGAVFALQALSLKRDGDADPILNDWNNITMQEYDQFRVSPEYKSARAGLPNPNAPKSSPTVPLFVKPRDALGEFRKNSRRDANAFIPLKEDKQWGSWQRSTVAQARAQDLSDILDAAFVPDTPNYLWKGRSFSMLSLKRTCSPTKERP
jgi:hypothetical protein